jgi:hypothetical protein
LDRGSLHAGVERLYVLLVNFGINNHCYEPPEVESGLDKFWVVP